MQGWLCPIRQDLNAKNRTFNLLQNFHQSRSLLISMIDTEMVFPVVRLGVRHAPRMISRTIPRFDALAKGEGQFCPRSPTPIIQPKLFETSTLAAYSISHASVRHAQYGSSVALSQHWPLSIPRWRMNACTRPCLSWLWID